jgi:hypothetical protein
VKDGSAFGPIYRYVLINVHFLRVVLWSVLTDWSLFVLQLSMLLSFRTGAAKGPSQLGGQLIGLMFVSQICIVKFQKMGLPQGGLGAEVAC